jgi:nucleoside-diphosphate-sugar epimerase
VQVVVTGACSVLGQELLRAIVARGSLTCGALAGTAPVRRIIAVDRRQTGVLFVDDRIEYVRGNYEQSRFLARMMGVATDSVFHLLAPHADTSPDVATDADPEAPAGDAADAFDNALLYSVDTTRALLDACRLQTLAPRLVFARAAPVSRRAGVPPASTEEACAAICELLVLESARHGITDARSVRLPCVAGNAVGAAGDALTAALERVAAGDRAAADERTPVKVVLPAEAAAALLEAHERPRAAPGVAQIAAVPGRTVRLGALAQALATVPR